VGVIRSARAYDEPAPRDEPAFLVERLWPRGVMNRRGHRAGVQLAGREHTVVELRHPTLAGHAVAEVDDSRAEGAGLDEFEIHPAPVLGKERNATADQHRIDLRPVLVDET
jgi:hypothetical protein